MNAISHVEIDDCGRVNPDGLMVAAAVLAYPVASGALAYGGAVDALARTAIRMGAVDESTEDFELLLESLEHPLNKAIADIAHEAARDVRKILQLCMQRGTTQTVTREAAIGINNAHGSPLPQACLDWMIAEYGGAAARV